MLTLVPRYRFANAPTASWDLWVKDSSFGEGSDPWLIDQQ